MGHLQAKHFRMKPGHTVMSHFRKVTLTFGQYDNTAILQEVPKLTENRMLLVRRSTLIRILHV